MQRCAVIGLGLFGTSVALEMSRNGAEVLAIDSDIDKVEAIKNKVTHAVCLDATDENALRDQGVHNMDIAVVAVGVNFEASLIATSILKQFGISKIFARATSPRKEGLLNMIGGDSVEVINPEESAGKQMALTLISQNAVNVTELADDYLIIEIPAPREFIGRTIRENEIRKRYNMTVVALKKPTGKRDSDNKEIFAIHNAPEGSDLVEERDRLLMACSRDNADNLPWD